MKHNTLNKNFKTNPNSQKTANSIILLNKITVLVNTQDYFGIGAKRIPIKKLYHKLIDESCLRISFYPCFCSTN